MYLKEDIDSMSLSNVNTSKVVNAWNQCHQAELVLPRAIRMKVTEGTIIRVTIAEARVPFQYPQRRLTARSREVSNARDLYLELSDLSQIWQAHRQHCSWCACQISKRCNNLSHQSRGFETSWDLTIRRLSGYWNGAQCPVSTFPSPSHSQHRVILLMAIYLLIRYHLNGWMLWTSIW